MLKLPKDDQTFFEYLGQPGKNRELNTENLKSSKFKKFIFFTFCFSYLNNSFKKDEINQRYDSIMLPPDENNRGFFGKMKDYFKSFFDYYDYEMPYKYIDCVIKSMLHELVDVKSDDVLLENFCKLSTYCLDVFSQMCRFYENFNGKLASVC